MLGRLMDRWEQLPTWAKWTIGVSAFYLIVSVFDAWGEERFVGGIAESLVARVVVDGSFVGGLIGGVVLGRWAFLRTGKNVWIGWLAGIVAFMAIGSLRFLGEAVPGVGWRIRMMNDSNCETDWDGRANPTVCEQ